MLSLPTKEDKPKTKQESKQENKETDSTEITENNIDTDNKKEKG